VTSEASLRLLAGGGGLSLGRTDALPRLRPGERPLALDLSLLPEQLVQLRRRAHLAQLGVDALLSLVAEFDQIKQLLTRHHLLALLDQARVAVECSALSAAPELRGWQRVIEARTTPSPDELPTVFLPLRVLAPVMPENRATWVSALAEASDAEVGNALLLERVAVRTGVTMQMWALSALARRAADSPRAASAG
jgi:hypothetical protein